MRGKIKLLEELPAIVDKHKKRGKNVGLITGCFDILHIGHIELFQAAKCCVDILIVGVENDETIRRSKGANRPLNNQNVRLRFLEVIQYIDYIFFITDVFDYSDNKKATIIHDNIVKTVSPHFIITSKKADRYWKNKEKRASKFGAKLLDIKCKNSTSTSKILDHLLSEL